MPLAMARVFFRTNSEITAPQVRVVGPDGKPRGVFPIRAALRIAQDFGMDLVEVAPDACPPTTFVVGITMFLRRGTGRGQPEGRNN